MEFRLANRLRPRSQSPLADIACALDEPDWDLHHVMLHRRDLLDDQIGVGAGLRRELSRMLTGLAHENPPTTKDHRPLYAAMPIFMG
ncbi:hypothetical protein I550_3932 [Mycobacterium intracellulare 1956]|uniref:Uncharacterized protein n=1 Tax=Mycobacterium intracellulare 1956 TaxID=1299331 RepID=X8CKN0_MYCIT|nr:hypothetical protein I550_3932 [Mycobacterium intracellulare 1956]